MPLALRRALAILVLVSLVRPSGATWSIVAIDTRTGEVAVASATCLTGVNLKASVPALLVGRGGGAAQSAGDPTGELRQIMVQGFADGLSSQEILELIEMSGVGNLESQQFGVVSFVGDAVTRTGSQNGSAATGVAGEVDGIRYAIQGNVLTGNRVVRRAEGAFLAEPGDLSQRVMAAMEKAREFGGDGRCSCSMRFPTSCGSPPPEFEKSAHVGFVVVARVGDADGVCGAATGCVNGDYWLDLNVIGGVNSQDPVLTLRGLFDAFRRRMSGKPDGTLSSVDHPVPDLPADGRTRTVLELVLRDLDGVPLAHGEAEVTASLAPGTEGRATVLGVTNEGDGRYSIELAAGLEPGEARLELRASLDGVEALVHPPPVVRVAPVTPLFCGFAEVDVTRGIEVPLVLNVPGAAGASYVILGSASGTSPGVPFAGGHLPLNPDRLFGLTRGFAGGPFLPGTAGRLDADGHAQAAFVAPPLAEPGLLGLHVDWAGIVFARRPRTTNAAGFDVVAPLAP